MKKEDAENIKLIKGFYKAMAQNDWAAAREVFYPDIEWTEFGAPGLWFHGRRYGSEAVFKDVIDPAYGKFDRFGLKMKKFFAVGDKVIALGHFRGRSNTTELNLYAPTAHIWTIANGRAVRFQGFHDTLEWQVALGLTTIQNQCLAA
jgi:uncharacterized protein